VVKKEKKVPLVRLETRVIRDQEETKEIKAKRVLPVTRVKEVIKEKRDLLEL
jgi:hypothetical protein